MTRTADFRSCVALAALLMLPAGACADEELSAELKAKLQDASKRAVTAFKDGKYEEATKVFLEFAELLPKAEAFAVHRARAHYYIACSFNLLGKKPESLDHLGKALEHGYRDFDEIESDGDLASLRDESLYKQLLEKYRKVEDERLQKFDFDLETVDGKRVAKKDFLGKVLIVDVWGTWCPPCRQEIPHFVELMKKHKDKGFQIVGLNNERFGEGPEADAKAREHVLKFIKNNDINYPCALVPDKLLELIPNFSGFPTTLFIGRDGRIRKKVVGYHDLESLEHEIKPLLEEKAPEAKPAENKPAETK